MSKKDPQILHLGNLDWSSGNSGTSLESIYKYIQDSVTEIVSWYRNDRNKKKKWGKSLRVAAIITLGVAGVLPVISQIATTHAWPSIDPSCATILFGLSAMLAGLDHYFGCSSAWVRYMETELQINKQYHQFQLAWQTRKASWQTANPTKEELLQMLQIATDFFDHLDSIVELEAQNWALEFRQTILRLDDASGKGHGGGSMTGHRNGQLPDGGNGTAMANNFPLTQHRNPLMENPPTPPQANGEGTPEPA